MSKKMYANIEIKQLENDLFSVKLNGQEISQYITSFTLFRRKPAASRYSR